ncbi:beta-1,3-galactosyltransferase 1-like [Mercenaria mercenaria]|uniref:beta-1,3-galactosyltransferase 1-like n=1 Tax=Mercenaria mercenaria TaxID=6596 RepID=UPI00234EA626|nr:beta-1,3-galactosyltransferase 1-like [Mercenaria mercenaria]
MASKMKVKKKWTYLCCGKVPTKFILLMFLALTIYVCISLVSSTSMLSLKVDMFIKMRDITMDTRSKNISAYNETGARTFEIDKGRSKQRLIPNIDDTNFNNSFKKFDGSAKPSYNVNFNDAVNGLPVKIQDNQENNLPTVLESDSKRKYTLKENITESKEPIVDIVESMVIDRNETSRWFEPYSEENEENKTSSGVDIFGNTEHGTDKKRKLNCDECFQHNFNYLIENDICKLYDSVQIIDLVILITTSAKNTKARAALRATWLSFTRRNTANIRYAFLLGEEKESRYSENVIRENDAFHDIIKEDFIDSYMNLTYKTIMGFKWAATKCAHALFVMKTDDDMFVNIPNVLKITKGPLSGILQSAIAGSCNQKAKPIRNRKSKWYASVDSYPQQFYPGFCSGTGYVTSMNVAAKIYRISPSVPFFHLEDVYVSLCLRKLGFKLQRVPGFNAGRRKLDPCLFKGNILVTAHQMSPVMLRLIWNRRCTRLHF